MKIYLISDTHFNHGQIATYCDRPADFTERIIKNWRRTVQPTDMVIHLGDVFIGKPEGWKVIYPQLPGRKVLVRGNHDHQSCAWYMEHGFDWACDMMEFRGHILAHHPPRSSRIVPQSGNFWIHGHLHNVWHGFHRGQKDRARMFAERQLRYPWQRLFAIEYCSYGPVEFEKFISHPEKFQSRGPHAANSDSAVLSDGTGFHS